MGDRANILIKDGEEQVCLYTHWDGYNLPSTLQKALLRGKGIVMAEKSEKVEKAERNLTALLNYGGIFMDHMHHHRHLTLEYQQGDLADEISHMRSLATAFAELADALEVNGE